METHPVNSKRLTNQIFAYFLIKKTKGSQLIEMEKDQQEAGINQEREHFRKKLIANLSFKEKSKLKINTSWIEQTQEEDSENTGQDLK